MSQKGTHNLVVGLDIGSSKIVVLVADLRADGELEIIGLGEAPSRGIKKGAVVDIEFTIDSIQRALEAAELMADCKIDSVFAGITGNHIRSFNSHGMVAIKDKEVTQSDVDRVIETARAVSMPAEHQILHILNQEFIIDGQEDVKQPLGMSGVRLEAKVHIVTTALSAVQNITRCVRRCGLTLPDLTLQSIASAESVLSEDERELGVCLVDLGCGTTDIAVFCEGAIRHTAVIPIAGEQVTNDIAMAFHTPTRDAEEIKCRHGIAYGQMADPEVIDVPGIGERGGPRSLSRQTLAEVIEPRIEELYTLIQDELRRAGFDRRLSSGLVLTGGSAQMEGMVEFGQEIFHLPVRLGQPHGVVGHINQVRSPAYAMAVGLVLWGRSFLQQRGLSQVSASGIGSLLHLLRNWMKQSF